MAVPVGAIGIATFVLPQLGLSQPILAAVFPLAMAAVAATILVVPMVATFLIDTGKLLEAFVEQASRVFLAAVAFLTFYSVLDLLASAPNFVVAGERGGISLPESHYLSVTTMATVAYGNITPPPKLRR